MTFLVTGGAGFIGSHVVDKLLEKNEEVVCIDILNDYYNPEIKKNNIANNLNNKKLHFFKLNIENKNDIETVFKKFNIKNIIHLAARAGVRNSILEPLKYQDSNVKGTLNLLQLSHEYKIKSFVFASSSSVYGGNKKIPFSEEDNTDKQLSPYAASKKACEVYCYTYSYLHNLSVKCLRFFTVYGPRNRPDMQMYKFPEDITQNKPITIFGKENEIKRDWTYISDVVQGVLKSVDLNSDFEIINIGNNKPNSVDYVVKLFEKKLNKKAIINRASLPLGDVPVTAADTKKVEKLLNWKSTTNIEEGVEKLVQWFNSLYKV